MGLWTQRRTRAITDTGAAHADAGRAGRTGRGRAYAGTSSDAAWAAFALWGSWLLVTGLIFSLMQGIFHAYYTVALAPAIAALVGMGTAVLWSYRRSLWAAGTLALTVAVTAVWSWVLLSRSSEWNAWLGPVVLVAGGRCRRACGCDAVGWWSRQRCGAVAGRA
ncbi:hypothetical protein [Nonomuraea sp. bgisy101]|uniref:hypothetical protein n=1 Tax=Nonomuraea sp. bgisy101 TaxID=3413784 RepID=UPI003D7033B8